MFLSIKCHIITHYCELISNTESYKGCFKSIASYFIMLAHRCRCWWYGSRSWTFPPMFHYILLPCDRWQQRNNLTKWHLIWKYVWSKCVSLNSSMQKKMAPIDIYQCWPYVYGDQIMDVSTVRWWVVCFSSGNNERQATFRMAMHSCHTTNEEHLDQLIHANWLMVVTTLKTSIL